MEMKKNGPIGIFDSGYGGLTILDEIRKVLPQYDYLYLGDNARSPYGSRSFDVIYQYTLEAVEELFSRGCHLVILACNTASAKALRTIQQKDIPRLDSSRRVLGVIRPSTEEIGDLSHSGHVGLLATEGTIRSNSYPIELAKYAPQVTLYQQVCPMWVPLIENNLFDTKAGKWFIEEDIHRLLGQNEQIDTILLGCTHYPILRSLISTFLPPHVQIISQGPIVARKLKEYLINHPEIATKCSTNGEVEYLTTENATVFNQKAGLFLEKEVDSTHLHL
jgi:glutamate racemase